MNLKIKFKTYSKMEKSQNNVIEWPGKFWPNPHACPCLSSLSLLRPGPANQCLSMEHLSKKTDCGGLFGLSLRDVCHMVVNNVISNESNI
jgi:hypothetical protein